NLPSWLPRVLGDPGYSHGSLFYCTEQLAVYSQQQQNGLKKYVITIAKITETVSRWSNCQTAHLESCIMIKSGRLTIFLSSPVLDFDQHWCCVSLFINTCSCCSVNKAR